MKASIPPKTKLGEAVSYTLNEYQKLVRYLKYVATTPDNNGAENAMRPFVVGRKNWLFCDTPRGAHASAIIYHYNTEKLYGCIIIYCTGNQ